MNKQILILILLFVPDCLFGGVYRHDVSPDKYKRLATQAQFDCVGMVLNDDENSIMGSCVLIGNRYVLCAAHVLIKRDFQQDTIYMDTSGRKVDKPVKGGFRVVVNQPQRPHPASIDEFVFRFKRRIYPASKYTIFPVYLDSLDVKSNFYGDLVVIELKDTVVGITPAKLNKAFNELKSEVTGVGYGASGPASMPEEVGTFMEKIAGTNVVDAVKGYVSNGHPSLLGCDFDHPTRTDYNKSGSPIAKALEWAPSGGDSGGGVFRQDNSTWELVAIITGGASSGIDMEQFLKTGYYGCQNEFTRVSVFYDWIMQTMHGMQNDTTDGKMQLSK